MQLPTVERSPNLRPAGADMVAPAATKVIPVAPVNPSVQATASVVNDINPELQTQAVQSEVVQTAKADPLQGGSLADSSIKDWTQRKSDQPKPEEPPKEPISKLLIEHIHALWTASGRVVEIWLMNNPGQNQTQNLAESRNQNPSEIPGVLAKEALTYSPSKIKKPDSI